MASICSDLLNSKLKIFNNIIYKVDDIFPGVPIIYL